MAASFVQINKLDFITSQATFAVSFSSGVTAGNFIVVAGSFTDNATGVTVDDGHGNAVTDSGKGIIDNASSHLRSFVKAFFAPTAGATTITATYSGGSPTAGDLFIWEISGLTNAKFDQVAETAGNSAAGDSGSTGTLSSATEAAIAFGNTSGGFTGAPGTNWTVGQGSTVGSNTGDGATTNTASLGEHRVIAATTAINGTGALSGATDWTMWCATFMAAPGTAVFRRTLSQLGTRTGSRQTQGAGF